MSSQRKSSPFLSVVIPAHNEEDCIETTITSIVKEFETEGIDDYEILVINDNSTDETSVILDRLAAQFSALRWLNNAPPNGFGLAVRRGLEEFRGESVCVCMADLSDDPKDIVRYYRELKGGAECVFGSRFIQGGGVYDYPIIKKIINRMANTFIRVLFGIKYNDVTNAFKAYKREVIEGGKPMLAKHFNLTVEIPLKAIVRGYSYKVIPISWTNRVAGVSKLHLTEMGSRYLFIVLYVLLEKWLTKADYKRVGK